jgi:hypothetical protein
LTFDDGPNPTWTPQVLEVLRRHAVHGTFFVVGDGNLVGNHTWDHPTGGQGMYGLTADQVAEQVDRTEQLLQEETGQSVCFFRAPQGKDSSADIRDIAVERGLTVTNMHSAHDYRQASEPDPTWVGLITDRLVGQGDHPILLLHDGGGYRGNSVAALDRVITWYAERGYVFTDPAGRPFPDDPTTAGSSSGYALEPTTQQRQAQIHRSAAKALTGLGEMTNARVPEQEEPSAETSPSTTSSESSETTPQTASGTNTPGLSVVPGQRPGLAGSAPL